MPLFRFHRGCLNESLATTVIVRNMNELMYVIQHRHEEFSGKYKKCFGIIIEPYPFKDHNFDKRIGWYTQIVTSDILEKGIFFPEGFLSEPLDG